MQKKLKKIYKYNEIGLFGALIQEVTIKLVPLLSFFIKNPNWLTTINYILAGVILYSLANGMLIIAGSAIVLAQVIDLMDGYLARYLSKSSIFGKVLDAFADFIVWLAVIVGLFMLTKSYFPFYILSIYLIDVYGRSLLNSDFLGYQPEVKKGRHEEKNIFQLRWWWHHISFVFSHIDSMVILVFILIIEPSMIIYWFFYEFIRRMLGAIKRMFDLVLLSR